LFVARTALGNPDAFRVLKNCKFSEETTQSRYLLENILSKNLKGKEIIRLLYYQWSSAIIKGWKKMRSSRKI